ncbi:hypothetical protein PAPYR_12166 [Paratrimastix pyriformis]|uniref:Uncharacterized protein n=1 Tax=Paratrimastix pyriformis TaxID=342808 RepID=A0ABQ8U2B9_9EUKA|nr:hypothetical protein PAPYR_12166 [Paratrimastix pyriformis]
MDFSTLTNIVIPNTTSKIRFLLKINTAGMDFSTPTNIAIPVLMMQIDELHQKTLGMMSEHHLENSISIENPYRRYGFLVPNKRF